MFWLYLYLVEERGFTVIREGWIAAIPWLTVAAFTPVGGIACDRLGAKNGWLTGANRRDGSYALSGLLLSSPPTQTPPGSPSPPSR